MPLFIILAINLIFHPSIIPFFAPTEIAWNKRLNNNILINTLLTFFLQNQPILFFDSAKITYFDQTCTYIKLCEEKKHNIKDITNVLIWALQITCIFILHIWLSEIKDIRGQKRRKKREICMKTKPLYRVTIVFVV